MTFSRETDMVELVAEDGAAIGSSTVAEAHAPPGRLHRAFSVLLFDGEGRTLLQRRASTKTRFPLQWANACCGHPRPGEDVTAAATRRLLDELGVPVTKLTEAGVYAYAADDPATGHVEREYDHVLVGVVSQPLTLAPNPAEVDATRWTSARELLDLATGLEYAPWLRGVLSVALGSRFG